MFDWDRFKNGEIAVHCDTEEKANNFLNECDKQGIAWTDGDKTTEINCWFWHKKNTSYACSCGKSKLVFDFLGYHKDKGLEIIKWEIDRMKELTFKEVIANIKEGEVWDSENNSCDIRIERGQTGISIRDFKGNALVWFSDRFKFKLKRKEYTFEEAFKAYEEGNEIESISYRYKKINEQDKYYSKLAKEWIENDTFGVDEIKGKWYIND